MLQTQCTEEMLFTFSEWYVKNIAYAKSATLPFQLSIVGFGYVGQHILAKPG